jgi:phosphatidylglycerophosphatase A
MDYKDEVQLLERRGVTVDRIADIVLKLQMPYNAKLSLEECVHSVRAVLTKREVLMALMKRSLSVMCMYMV